MNLTKIFQDKEIRGLISESWSVSAPMTLIMVFEFLIGITDIYVAGKVGKEIQATYGFVIQLYFTFIIIANALTTGTVSVISRLFSSGDREDLGRAIFSILIVTAAAGLVFGVLGIVLTPGVISIVNIPPRLKPLGAPLGQIYAAGLVFHYILINTNGVLRSCKKVHLSLATMATVCGCNIFLNFLLVFGTPLGYPGIALATALSALIGCILNLRHLRSFVPSSAMASFTAKRVGEVAAIAWPFGLSQALWQVHSMVLYLILSSLPRRSIEILAAFSAGLRIESAAFLPAIAFHMANAVITGNLLGERRTATAFRAGLVTALMGVCLVVLIALGVVVAAPGLASMLSDNTIVMTETVTYLYVNMLGEPFMALWVILAGSLSGAGDTRSIMLIMAACTWLVRVPLCYLFVVTMGFEAHAVWWTMNLSQILAAALIFRRYMGKKWLPGLPARS
jgi:MATE family multidrug resistance protein